MPRQLLKIILRKNRAFQSVRKKTKNKKHLRQTRVKVIETGKSYREEIQNLPNILKISLIMYAGKLRYGTGCEKLSVRHYLQPLICNITQEPQELQRDNIVSVGSSEVCRDNCCQNFMECFRIPIPYHHDHYRLSMGIFKERPIHLHNKWRKLQGILIPNWISINWKLHAFRPVQSATASSSTGYPSLHHFHFVSVCMYIFLFCPKK